jgi:hypothetical protein
MHSSLKATAGILCCIKQGGGIQHCHTRSLHCHTRSLHCRMRSLHLHVRDCAGRSTVSNTLRCISLSGCNGPCCAPCTFHPNGRWQVAPGQNSSAQQRCRGCAAGHRALLLLLLLLLLRGSHLLLTAL